MLRVILKGNIEIVAELLKAITVADLFKIEPLVSYSKSYNKCNNQAQEDQRRDAWPELAAYLESLGGYDTIYLGYSNYWSTMPMAMECRFISYDPESCRLMGKIVNVSMDETVLTADGKVDVTKLAPIAFDLINSAYHVLDKKVGNTAFQDGLRLK